MSQLRFDVSEETETEGQRAERRKREAERAKRKLGQLSVATESGNQRATQLSSVLRLQLNSALTQFDTRL